MRLVSSLLAVVLGSLLIAACNDDPPANNNVSVSQLTAGDPNCPFGGVAIKSGSTTAYACGSSAGAQGPKGDQGEQGVPGVQGLPGGGYYVSRSNVYCKTVKSTDLDLESLPGLGTLSAECDSIRDLPLSGSCAQWSRSDVVLAKADSFLWDYPSTIHPAGWNCEWAMRNPFESPEIIGVHIKDLPTARAHICCVRVP